MTGDGMGAFDGKRLQQRRVDQRALADNQPAGIELADLLEQRLGQPVRRQLLAEAPSSGTLGQTVRKTHLPQITPRHDRHLIQFPSENHAAGSYARISIERTKKQKWLIGCLSAAGVLVVLSALAIGGFLMFMKWL